MNLKINLVKNGQVLSLLFLILQKLLLMLKKHLEENSQIIEWRSTDDLTKLKKKFITKSNYIAFKVVIARLSGYRFIYTDSGWQQIVDVCNEEFIKALEELTDYLEFYLTYLDKLDFEKQKIEKKGSNLDAIEELKNAKVLTFNYTDTANKLFNIPEENTHFIHGRIDFTHQQKLVYLSAFVTFLVECDYWLFDVSFESQSFCQTQNSPWSSSLLHDDVFGSVLDL